MLSPLREVQSYTLRRVGHLPAVRVALADALGSVVAAPVVADATVPPFANSAMDGYAIKAADTIGAPVLLSVIGTLGAGHPAEATVQAGQALRIMTGAPIPMGADCVVPIEQTRAGGDLVTVESQVRAGACIRRAGDDVMAGDVVAAKGSVLGPAHLGVLASIGVQRVTIHRKPRVGVLSTGDELVASGALRPGQIRDSNRPALMALVHEAGFEAVDYGVVSDDPHRLRSHIESAVVSCDVLMTSGGVSVGDLDHMKLVLDQLGDMRWFQIAIKPGKPFAFGVVAGTPVFALPGNPVASMVSFELLVRPAIRRMAGHTGLGRIVIKAAAAEPFPRKQDGKTHFVRVLATQARDLSWVARSAGGQLSHQLAAMSAANGLAVIPDGDGVKTGDHLPVMLLI